MNPLCGHRERVLRTRGAIHCRPSGVGKNPQFRKGTKNAIVHHLLSPTRSKILAIGMPLRTRNAIRIIQCQRPNDAISTLREESEFRYTFVGAVCGYALTFDAAQHPEAGAAERRYIARRGGDGCELQPCNFLITNDIERPLCPAVIMPAERKRRPPMSAIGGKADITFLRRLTGLAGRSRSRGQVPPLTPPGPRSSAGPKRICSARPLDGSYIRMM